MALAGDSVDERPVRVWLTRLAIGAAVVLVVGVLVQLARTFVSEPPVTKRQVAKVSILPDTPPPPPPPPREEPKREQPRAEQPRPQPLDQPKPVQAPPADAPIKMEGAAGDGPSAFAAGAVTQDYKGGAPVVGAAASTAPPLAAAVDRANERFYANTARQLLRDELQRQLKGDAGEIVATLAIWVGADGQIGRFELQPSGQPERDAEMRAALDATARALRLPPPPPVAQPMRFRVTLRPQG